LHELMARQRASVLPLIETLGEGLDETLADPLIARAIVAGVAPGRVWVDDPERPRSTLFWDHDANLCLVGDSDNRTFSQGLDTLLVDVLLPQAAERRTWGYVLRCGPGWQAPAQEWLHSLHPIEDLRQNYVHRAPDQVAAPDGVPEGLALLPVDADFIAHEEWLNIDEVLDWMRQCWASTEAYLEQGFGYALVDASGLLSWCLAEYVVPGACSLGIETDIGHQRQGLGTLVARAALAECARRGLEPHWDCWATNAPSVALARKLGFELVSEYSVLFGWWNPVDHLAIRGSVALRRGKSQEGVRLIERALTRYQEGDTEDAPDDALLTNRSDLSWSLLFGHGGSRVARWYVTAARTRMQLGDMDAAVAHLKGSLDNNWRGADKLESAPEWAPLHGAPGWAELLERLTPPSELDEDEAE